MISEATRAEIRRLFHAEHWRIGTIAAALGLHAETVRAALETARFHQRTLVRPSQLDPYLPFLRATLEQYPKLRATRLHEMIVARGYPGSGVQTRRVVRRLRPRPPAEAYLRLATLPGEQAQVDWGPFGHVEVGKARRPLSAFVMVLSWSRALHVLFTLDQTLESFLRGHVEAFAYFQGASRTLLYDNLKSASSPARATRSSSIRACSSWPATTTSSPIPVPSPEATRRGASSDRSASCGIASSPPVASATSPTSTPSSCAGGKRGPTRAPAPETRRRASPRRSTKSARGCFPCRSTPSSAAASWRLRVARPPTCASIATTTRSPRAGSESP